MGLRFRGTWIVWRDDRVVGLGRMLFGFVCWLVIPRDYRAALAMPGLCCDNRGRDGGNFGFLSCFV
jgi:hypothetical protein